MHPEYAQGNYRFTAHLFQAAPESLHELRRFTNHSLQRWDLHAVLGAAEYVVSELAAHVISLYAPHSSHWLALSHRPSTLLCVILPTTDSSPPSRRAIHRTPFRHRILDTLTEEWGQTRSIEGTIHWARVPASC